MPSDGSTNSDTIRSERTKTSDDESSLSRRTMLLATGMLTGGALGTVTSSAGATPGQSGSHPVPLTPSNGAQNLAKLERAAAKFSDITVKTPRGQVVPIDGTWEVDHNCSVVRFEDGAGLRQVDSSGTGTPVLGRIGEGEPARSVSASIGEGDTTFECDASGWEAGDYVYVHSNDPVKVDSKSMRGYLRQITAISGSTVTVDEAFPRPMDSDAGLRAGRILLAPPLDIKGGIFEHATPEDNWFTEIVRAVAAKDFVMSRGPNGKRPELRDGDWCGLFTYLTEGGSADIYVHNLIDDEGTNRWIDEDGNRHENTYGYRPHYGYGYGAGGGTRNFDVTGEFYWTRHAVTTTRASGNQKLHDSYITEAGEPEHVRIHDAVFDSSTSTNVSTHENGVDIVFENCLSKNPGRYQNDYGSTNGKENPDHFNMRSDATIRQCTCTHDDGVNVEESFGVVSQYLIDPTLGPPEITVEDCLIEGVGRGVLGKTDITLDRVTIRDTTFGVFNERPIYYGTSQIVGGDVRIEDATFGVYETEDSAGVDLDPVEFVDVGTKVEDNSPAPTNVVEGSTTGGSGASL